MPKLLVVSILFLILESSQVTLTKFSWVKFWPLAETVAKTGMILLAGEVTSHATVDYQKVVRDTIRQIGYDDSSKGVVCSFLFCLCYVLFLWCLELLFLYRLRL